MSDASRPASPERFKCRTLAAALIGLALLTGGGLASRAAACELRAIGTPDTIRLEYDPFIHARPTGRLDLELANDGQTDCVVRLHLTTRLGEPLRTFDLGGVPILFRVRDGSPVIARSAEPNVFDLTVPPGRTIVASVDAVTEGDAVPEAGSYTGDLALEVRPEDQDLLIPPVPVSLLLQSPPRAQVGIAGAAGAFGSSQSVEVLDLGDARTGLSKRAFLQIRANTDARLSIQSENGGVLKRPDDRSEESTISYVLTLDGAEVDLRHLVLLDVDPPRTVNGQSIPFDITLGAVGSQMAGRYQDVLMVDIDPR